MPDRTPKYQQFFAELKRRHVFRVMAVYGIVGFVILQIADLAIPALLLPEWTYRFVAFLLLVGFPIAVVIAWAFEITPNGIRKTKAADPAQIEAIVAQPAYRRWPAGLLALVGGALLLYGGWWAGRQSATDAPVVAEADSDVPELRLSIADGEGDERPAIAVLPFADMSPEGDQEYFSDGITEEISNTLAGIRELRVAGRTSAFAYKGRQEDLRRIGEELGVEYLIEGSVRKAGDRLRITAQLIDADDGSHLWSEQYDRSLDDVFEIQSEIAESVAEALTAPLGLEDKERLAAPTVDLDAYDVYLAGRARMRERGASLLEAKELFQAAIARDSGWAPPWAALAEVAELRIWHPAARPPEMSRQEFNPVALAEAERAARRALELDPGNASALVALGGVHRNRADWEEAERVYLQALGLDPDNAEAHQQYGDYLLNIGRIREGVAAIDRAASLDPAPIRLWLLALALRADDRQPEALNAYELSIGFESSATLRARTYGHLALTALTNGDVEQAIDAYYAAWEEDPDAADIRGPRERIERVVRALDSGNLELAPADFDTDGLDDFQWLMLGRPDSAVVTRIEIAEGQPFGRVIEFWMPQYDELRSDPRMEEYLRERGLDGVEPRRTPPKNRSRPMVLRRLDPQ